MKAYLIERFGGMDGLCQRDLPRPEPGLGQVVVKMHAAALNARDLMVIAGVFQPATQPGLIPLSDGAGEVVEVGDAVWRVRAGDRVALTFHPDWIGGAYLRGPAALGRGGGVPGVMAAYVVVSQEELVRIPATLSWEEACTLPCAALTAWSALSGYGTLLPGQTVLVQGTGGVAIFALQFARCFGARVIATTASPGKIARLRQLGTDIVVDTTQEPDWAAAVLARTGGEGVDVVVDIAGGAALRQSVQAGRECGRISLVGLFNGMPDAGADFFNKGIQLHPIRVGSREQFEQMNRAIEVNRVQPVIDRVFGFEEFVPALEYLQSGRHVGKVVVRIGA